MREGFDFVAMAAPCSREPDLSTESPADDEHGAVRVHPLQQVHACGVQVASVCVRTHCVVTGAPG